jgi:drug/metabolite transporter (DMT)-like permease
MSVDAAATAPARPLAGVGWMLVCGLCFVAVTAIVKHLGDRVPPVQAAFLRFALGMVFVAPMLGALARLRIGRREATLIALRGAVHTGGVICWFYAMTQIPLAEVTAMNYLNPVYVTLGAALFLGERLRARRVLAIAAALVGMLVILRPGFREVSPGHLAMLATAGLFAASYLVAKMLSAAMPPSAVVAALSVAVTAGLAPFALAVWVTPSLADLGWLFLLAAFATAGHYAMTLAFAAAPVTVTQPVTFLQLVWAVLLGVLVFGEPADGWVILGGGIIMAAVMVITWREAVARRRPVTPTLPETKV